MTGRDESPPNGDRARQQLVGRAAEQAAIGEVVDRALAGSPQVVIIEGAAGIGKSALARSIAAAMPSPSVVLWARGDELERQLDFGIVDQLLREAAAAGLPSPPTVGRGGARPDPLAVGASILGLVEAHGRDHALLVVVDDAQWGDLVSLQALSFAARRLHDRRAVLVIVQRPACPSLEPFHRLVRDGGGHRVRVDALGVGALADLVRAHTGLSLGTRAAARLHAHTGGSPLETLMLADELEPSTLTAGLGPLPAPRSYATMVLGRLAACSPAAESLVAAVAVAGALSIDGLARMPGCADLPPALSEAVASGLVELEWRGGRRVVDIAHPLIRSAVLDDLSPSRLCALHAAAAVTVDDAERAFRHELRAHLGEQPELAAAAIERAHARLADGWELSAVELLVLGAGLLGPGPARSAAVLQASHWLLTAGDTAAAADLLATAGGAGTPLDHLVRGELALLAGDSAAAADLLAAAVADEDDLGVAARAAGLLATVAANAARAGEAMAWARRALELSVRSGTDATFAMTMLVSGWALEGDLGAAEVEVAEWLVRLGPAATGPDVRYACGVLALWGGRLDEAAATLATLVDGRAGQGVLATSARYSLADCWYRQGRLDEALTMALETVQLLEDSEQLLSSPMAHGVAASVLAARGELDDARRHIAAAERASAATGNVAALLWVMAAQARVAVAADDPAGVVATLQPLADGLRDVGLPDGTQPWRADLVTALVATGQLDGAARELAELEARAGSGGPHVRARLARAAGILAAAQGDDDRAAAAFAGALAEDPTEQGELARARLELAAGSFERRRGRRRAAAELLDRAVGRFDRIGAAPFASTARRERDACGLGDRHEAGRRALTRAEASVAALVADGHTNREVAASLVVSVKTVESHLARIYDKLGVRSRTELAIEWRPDVDAAAP